jgi:microcystin-dependent protein
VAHTLSVNELPTHTHEVKASSAPGDAVTPTGNVLASPLNLTYRPQSGLSPMDAASLGSVGGSQTHLNMQPFLVVMFVIALQGIFPSRN